MKNKWYEVLGAGLLSVTAMYLCTALVVTGCSVDGDSMDAIDANENSEVVESGNDEEIEPSEVEESSKAKETSKEEVEASESEEQEPAEAEENTEAEEKPTTTPETEEPAESGDVAAPEEPTEPNKAEPEEKTDPAETTDPSEEKTEQAEPSNSEEKIEPIESAEPESVELNNAKEWEIIRDSVTSVVENNSIQYLHETRSFRLDRSDKILRLDEYRMPKDDFVAEYQYDGYDQHLTDRLYEDEILWEGFNWTNLNKPECRFKAGLDSILVGTNWPEIYVEMYAIYDVRYFCQSLGLEGNLSIWIPVRYRAKQD